MGGGMRVLHVDDEPGFARMGAKYLEREDERFHVETATSVQEGLDTLDTHDEGIECIVSDYDMPRRNGIDFLEAVRETHPDLPFILFTGKGSEEVAVDAIRAGATDYLQKQSGEQFQLLANRIRNAVSQYRATRAERHLRELAETTDRILYIFEHDWSELLFVSPVYEEIWGRSVAELRENPSDFLEGIHPDDREMVREHMAKMTDGESITIEYRVNPEEEYGRWVRVRGEPIVDDEGAVVRVAGFATEITEEKRRKQELEHQRSVLESVVDTVPHGILVVDENREFFTYNRQFVEMWDVPDEVVETGDDQEALESVLDRLEHPDEFVEKVEYFYDHPDEESRDLIHLADGRTFERYTAPVEGTAESYLGRVWLFREITDAGDREGQH